MLTHNPEVSLFLALSPINVRVTIAASNAVLRFACAPLLLSCPRQYAGFGTLLMEEAERIAREEHGSHKLSIIAGVGTRNYYRKLGYELDGPYMSKWLV